MMAPNGSGTPRLRRCPGAVRADVFRGARVTEVVVDMVAQNIVR